ncbi:MAG: hypothetical protein R3E82_21220 [Pseudomonadales bacterium]
MWVLLVGACANATDQPLDQNYSDGACAAPESASDARRRYGITIFFGRPRPGNPNPYEKLLGIDGDAPILQISIDDYAASDSVVMDVFMNVDGNTITMVAAPDIESTIPHYLMGGKAAEEAWKAFEDSTPTINFTIHGQESVEIPLPTRGHNVVDAMINGCLTVATSQLNQPTPNNSLQRTH